MSVRAFTTAQDGAAAAEMALVLPILLALLFGSLELGNYFYNEHILLKSVRDGARYAARRELASFTNCSGTTSSQLGSIYTDTRAVVRRGVLTGGSDRLPAWQDANFSMSVSCFKKVGSTDLGGFYAEVKDSAGLSVGAPVVTVSAVVDYQLILGHLGLAGASYSLRAEQQAAVVGW
jgi:hypothetical protein